MRFSEKPDTVVPNAARSRPRSPSTQTVDDTKALRNRPASIQPHASLSYPIRSAYEAAILFTSPIVAPTSACNNP